MKYPVGVGNLMSKLTSELGTGGVVGIFVRVGMAGGLTSQLISGPVGTHPGMQETFP